MCSAPIGLNGKPFKPIAVNYMNGVGVSWPSLLPCCCFHPWVLCPDFTAIKFGFFIFMRWATLHSHIAKHYLCVPFYVRSRSTQLILLKSDLKLLMDLSSWLCCPANTPGLQKWLKKICA